MKIISTTVLLLSITISQTILAKSNNNFKSPWELAPGKTLPKVIKSSPHTMISGTNSISWPDGRSVIVIHIGAGAKMYRCVDYFDSNFQATGHACYILKQ